MKKIEFSPIRLGGAAAIYSIRIENDQYNEYQKFFILFKDSSDSYLKDDFERITEAIEKIAKQGAFERLLRTREGKMKDRVCAMPCDIVRRDKNKHGTLRLYCLRISDKLLIIGSGGEKRTDSYNNTEIEPLVTTLQAVDKELFLLERKGHNIEEELINLTVYID